VSAARIFITSPSMRISWISTIPAAGVSAPTSVSGSRAVSVM
jgi:hypothetical protein